VDGGQVVKVGEAGGVGESQAGLQIPAPQFREDRFPVDGLGRLPGLDFADVVLLLLFQMLVVADF
jgi:hypothetical protein